MVKKLLVILLPLVGLFLLSSNQMSDNGRAGRTGSPGETTCTACHSDFTLNSGGGSISIQSTGTPGFVYTPGQTYNMSVTVTRSSNNLFGVGIEALTASNDNAGTLNITNSASTQIKSVTVNSILRRNVVHTFAGGAGVGAKVFNFSWTAPATGTGNVTFYFAGIAADADGNEEGDYVYSGSQVFTEGTCAPPSQPGNINGSTAVCSGSSQTYSIAAVSGATAYSWTLPGGWTGTSTSNSINVTPGSTSGTISVTANNACGNSTPRTLTVSSNAITGSTSVTNVNCNGGANGSASVSPAGGTSPYTYAWTPSGGTGATANGLPAGNYSVTVSDANGCRNTFSATVTQPMAISANVTSTAVSCFGSANGTATVTATGGNGGFTYSWSPGGGSNATATNLQAGTYTVTVTDANGCTKTATTSVSQPAAISIAATGTDATCGQPNGTATAAASGGTGPYTYSWNSVPVQTSSNATGLGAGTYVVTVTDANTCTQTGSVVISQPSTLSASSMAENVLCNGGNNGMAWVSASGGTPGYTFSWNTNPVQANDTAFNLPAGNYTAIVTDLSGCSFSTTVQVTEPTALVVSAGADQSVCEGSQASLGGSPTASGGAQSYSYYWSPSQDLSSPVVPSPLASPVAATIYSVTVTDANGCTSSSSVYITVNPLPVPVVTLSNDSLFSTPASSYQWYYSNSIISGATDSWYVPQQNGDYSVFVIDANGCSDTSTAYTMNSVGIANIPANRLVNIYPNPVSGVLHLSVDASLLHSGLSIIDQSGRLINKWIVENEKMELDLSGYAKGMYTIQYSSGKSTGSLSFYLAD